MCAEHTTDGRAGRLESEIGNRRFLRNARNLFDEQGRFSFM
jgi:hypothetical protein